MKRNAGSVVGEKNRNWCDTWVWGERGERRQLNVWQGRKYINIGQEEKKNQIFITPSWRCTGPAEPFWSPKGTPTICRARKKKKKKIFLSSETIAWERENNIAAGSEKSLNDVMDIQRRVHYYLPITIISQINQCLSFFFFLLMGFFWFAGPTDIFYR